VQEEQVFELVLWDGEQAAALMDARVG
jgi:hypothetical protein